MIPETVFKDMRRIFAELNYQMSKSAEWENKETVPTMKSYWAGKHAGFEHSLFQLEQLMEHWNAENEAEIEEEYEKSEKDALWGGEE